MLWAYSRVLVAWIHLPHLRLQHRPRLRAPVSQISSSECSLLEEQMRAKLPYYRESVTQRRVQRSTSLVRRVLASWYVLIPIFVVNLTGMANPGSTRPHRGGWMHTSLSATTDNQPFDSVAFTILMMKSSLRSIRDMFSTTPADLRRAVQRS